MSRRTSLASSKAGESDSENSQNDFDDFANHFAKKLVGKSIDALSESTKSKHKRGKGKKAKKKKHNVIDSVIKERNRKTKVRSGCGTCRYRLREILDSMGVMLTVCVLVFTDVIMNITQVRTHCAFSISSSFLPRSPRGQFS